MLEELLCRPDIELTVSTAGHGFVEAVKFYFPKLLLEPFYHCRQYFEYITVCRNLMLCFMYLRKNQSILLGVNYMQLNCQFQTLQLLSKLTSCSKDKNDFDQALSVLTPLKGGMECLKIPNRTLG